MLVVALLLAACGAAATGGGVAAPTQGAVTAAPAQPTQAPAPTQAAEPTAPAKPGQADQQSTPPKDGVLVIFQKTGGIAGIDETMTVYADGRIELTNRKGVMKTAQVTSADLSKLQQALADPEFAKLKSRYMANGADMFIYTLTMPGAAKQTIITMDGAQNPPVLKQALSELQQLRSKVQ
jgi:hypothetical protein